MANEVTIKTQNNELAYEPKYWSKKSAKELRDIIKILTEEANERIEEYSKGEPLTSVENQIKSLKASSKVLPDGKLGIGKLQSTKKEVLVARARQLHQFHNWDFLENQGREKILESETVRLNSLKTGSYSELVKDLSEMELRKITEAMGAVGDEILEKYGSSNIIGNDIITNNITNIDLTEIMLRTYNENKKLGNTKQELLLDLLKENVIKALSNK